MKHLAHLNKYFYKYRGRLLLGTLFVTLACLCSIFPAQFTRHALDEAKEAIEGLKAPLQNTLAGDAIIKSMAFYALLIILLALLRGVFMFFMRQTIIVISRYIEYDMKNEIYAKYQQLDATFFGVNSTGDLMNRISEDVGRVRMYVGPVIMYAINLFVTTVCVVYVMININATLTFYVLLPLPILVFIIYKVHDIINKKSDKVQSQLSTMSTFVQESFSGIRVLKAFAREKEFENAFDKQCADYKNASMELARVNAFFFPSITLLIGVSSIITIYVGGLAVINNQLTVGNIAEFVIYVNMLTWPVASLGWIITLIQRAAASQQRINEFLSIPISIKSSNNDDKTIDGKIAFNNVSFTYSNSGITALRHISFVARPGECIAFIGKTGSGKSTIANLLLRLYDTANGEILIDDKNITQHNLQNIREQIGYVPQEVFLFSDTIKHNILFGIKDTTNEKSLHEKMLASAHDAAIYDNIINFNDGFETMLGERGINLSGGQKQRVSIARAIVKEPRILIFDDCLSAVDTETEETILQNLQRIMKDKTTVIISHRVSSVKTADTIYVLDDGKIMEHGSHHQLIEANGIYKTMYDTQTNREKLQAQLAE